MNKKNLILSSLLCGLSALTFFIMFIPIISVTGYDLELFTLISRMSEWYMVEEYVWGIAALISIIVLPLLFFSSILSIFVACGEIRNKITQRVIYIVNIVLSSLVVGVVVNYFLGLGNGLSASGLELFKGETFFKYSTAFFYLHTIFSIAMLVIACFNFNKSKKTKNTQK